VPEPSSAVVVFHEVTRDEEDLGRSESFRPVDRKLPYPLERNDARHAEDSSHDAPEDPDPIGSRHDEISKG